MGRKLEIKHRNVSELIPYAKNAKRHPAWQIKQIVASIEQFGFCDPIATWHDEIIEGHGRLKAAKELGMETVPTVALDDLTDEQRRAYLHVHNQITLNSETDWATLLDEIASMPEINWQEFGFETYSPEAFSDEFTLPDLDHPEVRTITLQMAPEQHKALFANLEKLNTPCRYPGGNDIGQKIAEVAAQWEERQR